MRTMKVSKRDVVVVDLVARKVVFSLMDEFKTEGHGSTLCLRDNHVVTRSIRSSTDMVWLRGHPIIILYNEPGFKSRLLDFSSFKVKTD